MYFKIKIKLFRKILNYRNSNTMATEASILTLSLLSNTLMIKGIFTSHSSKYVYLYIHSSEKATLLQNNSLLPQKLRGSVLLNFLILRQKARSQESRNVLLYLEMSSFQTFKCWQPVQI